jgi:hypothetical protein
MIFPQITKPPKVLRSAYSPKIQGTQITGVWLDELSEPISEEMKIGFTDRQVQVILDLKDIIKAKLFANLDILPSPLQNNIKLHCVLTGGAISSLLHFEQPNDWDLYFKSAAAMRDTEQYCYKNQEVVKSIDPKYVVDTLIHGKCITTKATTLVKDVQLITMGGVEMIDFFDYVHCQPYYDLSVDKLFISPKQFDAIMHKKLIKNPNCKQVFSRQDKFVNRGWKPL